MRIYILYIYSCLDRIGFLIWIMINLIKSGIFFFSDKRSIDVLIVLNVLVAPGPGHRKLGISRSLHYSRAWFIYYMFKIFLCLNMYAWLFIKFFKENRTSTVWKLFNVQISKFMPFYIFCAKITCQNIDYLEKHWIFIKNDEITNISCL